MGGWVGKLITLSLPTRVEVELGCDNYQAHKCGGEKTEKTVGSSYRKKKANKLGLNCAKLSSS